MVALLVSSSLKVTALFSSPFPYKPLNHFDSPHSFTAFSGEPKALHRQKRNLLGLYINAQTLDFSGSFFEGGGGFGGDDDPPTLSGSAILAVEDKEEPQCPPGLRKYETMAVLRPDMSEDEIHTLKQKYKEVLLNSELISQPKLIEMAGKQVTVLLYRGGRMNYGSEGLSYSCPPKGGIVIEGAINGSSLRLYTLRGHLD